MNMDETMFEQLNKFCDRRGIRCLSVDEEMPYDLIYDRAELMLFVSSAVPDDKIHVFMEFIESEQFKTNTRQLVCDGKGGDVA